MANHIVNDGSAQANRLTAVPAGTKADTFVIVGAKRGLTKDSALLGANGLYYAVVGTADVIRIDSVPFAFADGDAVYAVPGSPVTFTNVSTGNIRVGYADRVKDSTPTSLFVVLTPGYQAPSA